MPAACTPRTIKLLNLTGVVPVFVKRTWKSAVFDVELNHSISILIAEFIVKFNTWATQLTTDPV